MIAAKIVRVTPLPPGIGGLRIKVVCKYCTRSHVHEVHRPRHGLVLLSRCEDGYPYVLADPDGLLDGAVSS